MKHGGKGYMDFNHLNINNDIEVDEFESVPLPDKVPSSVIPPQDSQSLKSRTVQTLLSQNQDLMARLTVALKRNIELEQKAEHQEDAYQRLQTQADSVKDQNEILSEKMKQADFEIGRLLDETSSLEKKFAELYTAYQDKITHIQTLSYRLHRFLKYKKKIRFLVRPFIQNLKFKIEALHHESIQLKEDILKKNETISELKTKLQESFEHIQKITQNFEKDQLQLVQYHENRFSEISQNFEALQANYANANSKLSEQKKLIEELKENESSLQNKAVYYERQFTDLDIAHKALTQEYESEKKNNSQRIQMLELQNQELSQKYAETLAAKNKLAQENQTLTDQLQSVQLLYQDNYQRTEDLKKMIEAQEQMNRELSQSLSEQRKRSDAMELKLYEAEEEFKRKIQSFQSRLYKKEDTVYGPTQPTNQKDLLNKIQSLLTDIQTNNSNVASDQLISENGDIQS